MLHARLKLHSYTKMIRQAPLPSYPVPYSLHSVSSILFSEGPGSILVRSERVPWPGLSIILAPMTLAGRDDSIQLVMIDRHPLDMLRPTSLDLNIFFICYAWMNEYLPSLFELIVMRTVHPIAVLLEQSVLPMD